MITMLILCVLSHSTAFVYNILISSAHFLIVWHNNTMSFSGIFLNFKRFLSDCVAIHNNTMSFSGIFLNFKRFLSDCVAISVVLDLICEKNVFIVWECSPYKATIWVLYDDKETAGGKVEVLESIEWHFILDYNVNPWAVS